MCPYNFVKAKLKLETMESGQVLSVLLDEGEPIRNVPRSMEIEGHEVLKVEQVGSAYSVWIKKSSLV
jgi:tRNA 2-thiouridine synthesizing protein A